jgi:APA family basic amino acid/polyamine antiporter
MRPVEVVQLLGSPWLVLLAWVLGGVFTLLMMMVVAEVAALMPLEGGQYAIMRNVYGDFWGYVFGWAMFALVNCAGTAGIAFIFSEYLEYFIPLPCFSTDMEKSFSLYLPMVGRVFPLEKFGVKMVSILVVSILTWISYRSTKAGGNLSVLFTVSKLAAIAILFAGFMGGGSGSLENIVKPLSSGMPQGIELLYAGIAALNATLLSYDGSTNMLNVSGEIRDPGRNIPRSMILGIMICIIVYMGANVGMMYVLGLDSMATSSRVASDAASLSFGAIGGGMVAFFICISVLGTTLSNILTPPRLTFAMARNNTFFKAAGVVHPRFGTPSNALLIHLFLIILFILTGSFYMLTDMYIFILWFFNLFFVGALFILRKRMPHAHRPYRAWGYPWVPLLVFVGNFFFLILVLVKDIRNYVEGRTILMNSVAAVIITALGIPLFYLFRQLYGKKDQADAA